MLAGASRCRPGFGSGSPSRTRRLLGSSQARSPVIRAKQRGDPCPSQSADDTFVPTPHGRAGGKKPTCWANSGSLCVTCLPKRLANLGRVVVYGPRVTSLSGFTKLPRALSHLCCWKSLGVPAHFGGQRGQSNTEGTPACGILRLNQGQTGAADRVTRSPPSGRAFSHTTSPVP